MPLVVDWANKLILVTAPDTSANAQDIHDFIEDQMHSPRGLTEDDILNPEGKIEDPTKPGEFSQIILVFNSPWQLQFWQGSGYTEIFGGKLVGGLNGEVIKATGAAGDITVLKSPVDGYAVAGSGGMDEATFHQYLDSYMKLQRSFDIQEADEEKDVVNNKYRKRHKDTKTILLEKDYVKDNNNNESLTE